MPHSPLILDTIKYSADTGYSTPGHVVMSNLEHHYEVYPEILIMIKLTVFFQESDGLVKRGRELEHYPYHDSVPNISYDKCSVIDTEYGGMPCRLKVGFYFF